MSQFTPHDILDPDKRHTMTVPPEFRIAKLERENADMLAALHEAEQELSDIYRMPMMSGQISCVEIIRAAIAKAEGRTP